MAALSGLLVSRRNRLLAVMLVASVAITTLAISAAGSSLSYYVTPDEWAQEIDPEGHRWRVGGRVVPGSIVEDAGRPVRFEVAGEAGGKMTVLYREGAVPNLFGDNVFVIVEGLAPEPGVLEASSVIIKHEDEFLTEAPAPPTQLP